MNRSAAALSPNPEFFRGWRSASLRSAVVTSFTATTDALTPDGQSLRPLRRMSAGFPAGFRGPVTKSYDLLSSGR